MIPERNFSPFAVAGFYPPGTKADGMLPIYAKTFPVTELNHTWYQMPKAQAIDRMRQHVPPDFRFAVKLSRTLTHKVDPDQWRGQAASSGTAFPRSSCPGSFPPCPCPGPEKRDFM